MSKKKDNKNVSNLKAEEPAVGYSSVEQKKALHIFTSFDSMEDDNYRWLASLTPEQHLLNATALIKRIFADDLKKNPHIGTTIHFD